MATRTWSSGSDTDFNDIGNWDGTGAILSTDDLVFDNTSVVNCTLTANAGSWTWDSTNGTISSTTLGCKSITITSGYTGTFDLSTYNLAVGEGGINCTGATGATFTTSAGSSILIVGPTTGEALFHIKDLATTNSIVSTLYFDNRISCSAFSGKYITLVGLNTTVGSYVIWNENNITSGTFGNNLIFGTIDIQSGNTMQTLSGTLKSTSNITGAGTYYASRADGGFTVEAGAVIDVTTVTFYVYEDIQIPRATYDCTKLWIYYFVSKLEHSPYVVTWEAGDTHLNCDFDITYRKQVQATVEETYELDFLTNSPNVYLSGDFTTTVNASVAGFCNATTQGNLILEGTADQVIDSYSPLNLVFDKPTVGTITIDGDEGNIFLGGDSTCQDLLLGSAYTGDFDAGSYDIDLDDFTASGTGTLDLGSGTWTCSGDFDFQDQTTLTRGSSTITMTGSSKIMMSDLSGTALNKVIVSSGASVTFNTPSVDDTSFVVAGGLDIHGDGTVEATTNLLSYFKTTEIFSTGTLNGNYLSVVSLNNANDGSEFINDGVITLSCLCFSMPENNANISAGTYNTDLFQLFSGNNVDSSIVFGAGNFDWTGDELIFWANDTGGDLLVDTDINNTTMNLDGEVKFKNLDDDNIIVTSGGDWSITGDTTYTGNSIQKHNFDSYSYV